MDNELRFVVSLKDNATRQARQLQHNLRGLNTTYRTSIQMQLIDNVSKKLKAIYKKISDQRGSIQLDMPEGLMNKVRYFFDALSKPFRSDESRKWYEKVYGYLGKLSKFAAKLGDTLVGGFLAAGAAIQTVMVVATAMLAKKMVAVNAEMEQYQVSLQTTLHSLTAAKNEMAEIVEFAKVTPYQIKEITDAVVKLSAYNMNIDEWLQPLGDMASAFGRTITDAVEAAADAVQGMFRRSLSYGIKMERSDFDQGGRYAGKTYAEAFMEEVKKRFAGGMELQAKTFKGIWSNIEDTFYISFQEATKPAFERIKQLLSDFYTSFDSESPNFNPQLVATVRDIFSQLSDILIKVVNYAEKFAKFFTKNILPSLLKLGKVSLELWSDVRSIIGTLVEKALVPLLTVVAELLEQFVNLVVWAKILLKIWLGFRVAVGIFKLLGFHMGTTAAKMVAANKSATMLGATLKIISARIVGIGLALGVMWIAGKFIAIRESIKDLGGAFDDIAGGAKEVENYLQGIGAANGFNVEEMAKAANIAKEYGNNMKNVLEISALAAGENNLNIPVENATQAIGTLADAFIQTGESLSTMRLKTYKAAQLLLLLKENSEALNLSFENVTSNFEKYSEVISKFGNDIESLEQIIIFFGKTAKQLGKEADLGAMFEEMDKLLAPTKEMLLSMPADTWITTADENLKKLVAEYKDASIMLENAQLKGAAAQIEAAEKQMEAADKVVASSKTAAAITAAGGVASQIKSNEGQGMSAGDNLTNYLRSWTGLITSIAGALTAGYVVWRTMSQGIKKVEEVTLRGVKVQTEAAKSRLANFGLKYAQENAKTIPGMSGEEVKAGRTWLARRLLKMEDKLIFRTLPSDMAARIERATREQVAILNKARNKAIEDLSKELSKAERLKGAARISRTNVLMSKMSILNKQFDDEIKRITKNYGDVAEAIKEGKLPTSLKQVADEILSFTDELDKAAKSAAKSAKSAAKTGRSLSTKGKAAMTGIFSVPMFGPGLRKIRDAFTGSGSTTQRMASAGAGLSQTSSSMNAAQKGTIVQRLERQWIGKQATKLREALMKPWTFLKGQGGYMGLGGEAGMDQIISRVDDIKSVSTDLAKKMATQYEGTKMFVQPHVLEQKLAEIAETGKIAKPLVASIDKLTGKMILLDGHTSTLAAEMAGLKELPIKIDTGNWTELIDDVVKRTGKTFPTTGQAAITERGSLAFRQLEVGAEEAATKAAQAATKSATKVATETASKASSEVFTKLTKAGVGSALDVVLVPTMANDIQELIRMIPGFEEHYKDLGYTMTEYNQRAGESAHDFMIRMQETVAVYDKVNTVGEKASDTFKLMGTGFYQGISPFVGLAKALVGKGSVMEEWNNALESSAGLIGDIFYGRDWKKKMSSVADVSYDEAFKQLYGISVADYQYGIDQIDNINKQANEQRLLDARKLAVSISTLYDEEMLKNSKQAKAIMDDLAREEARSLAISNNVLIDSVIKQGESLNKSVKKAISDKLSPISFEDYTEGKFFKEEAVQKVVKEAEEVGEKISEALAKKMEQASKIDTSTAMGWASFIDAIEADLVPTERVQDELKGLESRLNHLSDIEIPLATDKVQQFAAELSELEIQTKRNELTLAGLGQEMTNISSVFDLSIAYNELALLGMTVETTVDSAGKLKTTFKDVGGGVAGLEKEIERLNDTLYRQQQELIPLEKELDRLQTAYDDVKKSIDEAQESLDKFLNAPYEGEGKYQDQLYEIDRQINQLELDKLEAAKDLDVYEKLGLTDSDLYKQASAAVQAIDARIQGLTEEREELERRRDLEISPYEHQIEQAQRAEELAGDVKVAGVKAALEVIKANEPRLEQLQTEIDRQQIVVDKKNEEIKATQDAITAHEKEIEQIERKVRLANEEAQAAADKLAAQKNIYDLQGAMTDLGMIQLAQAMAQGDISTAMFDSLVKQYNAKAGEFSNLTRTQTGLNYQAQQISFDKDMWDRILGEAQAEQSAIIDKQTQLIDAFNKTIKGLNANSEGVKNALIDVFGNNARQNLQDIATATKKLAGMRLTPHFDEYGNFLGEFDNGGIARAAETGSLAMLHGTEAVIPLKDGAVPVKLTGNKSSQGTVIYSPTINIDSIVVRDDNDLEEVKQAILDLRKGQTSFFSRANQYPERF